jgi:hypothetical protein
VFFGFVYHNSFFNIEKYPDYLLLFALQLLVQIDGFCRLNVARPNSVPKFMAIPFSGGGSKVNLSKRTEQIESQNN